MKELKFKYCKIPFTCCVLFKGWFLFVALLCISCLPGTEQAFANPAPAPFTLSFTSSDYNGFGVSCNGASDGSIDMTINGGTAPFNILWSNGSMTEDLNAIAAGTYVVTVIDADMDTTIDSVQITEPAVIDILFSNVTEPTCHGYTDGSIDITPTGGTGTYSSFLWSNAAMTEDIAGIGAGTYVVTVTDNNGCTAVDSAVVNEPDIIFPNLVTVDANAAPDGQASVAPTGGTGTFTYLWSTGETDPFLLNLLPGTYTITITDANMCTAEVTAVIQNALGLCDIVTDSVNQVSCFGIADGAIYISTFAAIAPITYQWSGGQVTDDVTSLAPGNYSVIITDVINCTDTATFTITQPDSLELTLTPAQTTCALSNGSISAIAIGGTGAYQYLWSTGGNAATVSALAPGLYTLTVTDDNGCQTTDTASVTAITPPQVAVDSVTNVACFGASTGAVYTTTTGGTGPYSWLWSNAAITDDITGLAQGTYTVTVTDADLCTTTTNAIVNQPAEALNDSIQAVNPTCGASNGTLTVFPYGGTAGYSVLWSNLQITNTISGLSPGSYTVTITDNNGCTKLHTVTLTNVAGPVAVLDSVVNVQCFGGATGGVYISVSGGTGPFTYLWSNLAITQDIQNVAVNTYTVTVTDANLCTASTNGTVNQPASALNDSVQTANPTCGLPNGSATIFPFGGTGPYTFLWSNAQATATISGLAPGSYTVTITDANLCTRQRTATLTNIAGPGIVLDSVVNVKCFGGSTGGIFISVNSGTLPYSYLWSTGTVTQDLQNRPAGTYTVTVTDGNLCTATLSQAITQPAAALNDSVQVTDASCAASNGSITVFPYAGTGPYTYLWSNAQTTQTISGLAPGSYTVTITDANLCTRQQSASVVNISGPAIVLDSVVNVKCFGASTGGIFITVNAGTLPYTYLWNTGAVTQDLQNRPAGTYTVTVTDGNLCSATLSQDITQPASALNDSVQTTNPTCGLPNGSATIFPYGGTGPYSLLWSNAQSTATISGLAPGSYTVTITDANLCTRQRTATLTNIAGPAIVLDSVVNVKCFGGSTGGIYISVNAGTLPYSYLWNTGTVTQDIQNRPAGTYTVTVTDGNLCTATLSQAITQPAAALNDSVQVTNASCAASNGSITVFPFAGTSPYTYLWSNAQTTQTISGLAPGSYTVTITDANLCTRNRTATVINIGAPVIALDSVVAVRCRGGSTGGIYISVSGGLSPYTYLWSNAAVTQDISAVSAGNYTVTVTDASLCSASQVFNVTQPAAALNDSVQVTAASCALANGSVTVFPYGGTSPYTLLWSNAQTTSTISGLNPGVYTVTITDFNGCTRLRSYTVSNLGIPVVAVDSIVNVRCFGGTTGGIFISVSGGTAPYTYLWSNSTVLQDLNNISAGSYTLTITDQNSCSITFDTTLTQPAAALADSTQHTNATCGNNNGSITVFPYGGTFPYGYLWNTLQTTATINGLGAANYTVTVTDANGCTLQTGVTVSNLPGPVAAIDSVRNVSCFSGTDGAVYITVTGGAGPLTYSWSTGAITQDLLNVGAGNYTVTVTDANLCTAVVDSSVSQPPNLSVVNNTTHTTCNLANGSITATPSGGTPPYNYLWNTLASTQTINNLAAGIYTVTVTDALGCTANKTSSVFASVNPVVVIDSIRPATCNGTATGAIYASASGGTPPYGFLWSNGLNTSFLNNVLAGTYTVTVTDSSGCTAVVTDSIPQPAVLNDSMQVNQAVCGSPSGSITVFPYGGTSPYGVLWSNAQTTNTIFNLNAGVYTVTITDFNGCTRIDSATVLATGGPNIVIDSIVQVRCFGETNGGIYISVSNGTPGYSYLWSNGTNAQDLTSVGIGTYTVTVTDQNLCTATASGIVTQPSQINVTLNATDATCGNSNGSIATTVSGGTIPYTFAWNSGQSSQNLANVPAGIYTITVTDIRGCTRTRTDTILNSSGPGIVLDSIRQVSCFGFSNGAVFVSDTGGTGTLSYLWSTGALTQDLTGVGAGTYTLTIEDQNNCKDSATFVITQPDPLQDSVQVTPEACNSANGTIQVFPYGGTPPYSYLWSNSATSGNLAGLTGGTYTVTITDTLGCVWNDTVQVGISGGPQATLDSTVNVTCFGLSDGAAYISVSGGTGPYTYDWSSGDTTQDVINLDAQAHTVIIYDVFLCSDTLLVNITQPTELLDSLNYNPATCGLNNGSAKVFPYGGSPQYNVLWSNGQVTQTAVNLAPGTYTVTVTDQHGCTLVDSVSIPAVPAHIVNTDSIVAVTCFGLNDGKVYITVTQGVQPFSYLWSSGEITEDAVNLVAGVNTVTVTDVNSCMISKTFLVPGPDAIVDTLIVSDATCGQSNGEISVITTGGVPPYTYLWNNGLSANPLTGLSSGIYTVTVTDSTGCQVIETAAVGNVGGPVITTDSIVSTSCYGTADGAIYISVTGGTGSISYLWSGLQVTEDVTGLPAGNYSVTVTDSTGCLSFKSFLVDEPDSIQVQDTITNAHCGGANGGITVIPSGGTPNYSYLWNTGAATASITGLAAGNYTVTVTDAHGCTSVSSHTVNDLGIPAITVDSIVQVNCSGDSTGGIYISVSQGQGPYTYLWSEFSITQDISDLPAGTYTVTVTDQFSCSASLPVNLSGPTPLAVNFDVIPANCNTSNGSITANISGGNPGYTLEWSNNETAATISNLTAGVYTLTVTDSLGCQGVFNAAVSNLSAPVIAVVDSGNVTCPGGMNGFIQVNVSGGAAPYSYSWTNTPQTTPFITGLAGNTTYTLTVTDSLGCITIRPVFISAPPPITINAIIPQLNDTFNLTCYGSDDGSIHVFVTGGTPPYNLLWSNLATADSIYNLAAGNYTVTVTDSHGCTRNRSFQITQPPLLNSNAGPNKAICGDNSDTLAATPPVFGTGQWLVLSGAGVFANPFLPNTVVTGLDEGVNVFQWVVSDGTCNAVSQVVISYSTQITAIPGPSRQICADTVLLTATAPQYGSGYWQIINSPGSIDDTSKAVTIARGLRQGNNIFRWFVINGTCSDSSDINIFVKDPADCFSDIELPTGFTPNDDGRNDVFFIRGIEEFPDNSLVVFNRWGNKVYEKSGYANEWKGTNENGDALPDGTYFVILKVRLKNRTITSYVDLRR